MFKILCVLEFLLAFDLPALAIGDSIIISFENNVLF